MKPVGRLTRLLGLAMTLGILAGVTLHAAPTQQKAIVRSVRGTANYSTDRGANWKKLNVGATLNQNSVIRTAPGAIVDLFLGDNGPVVRVTEDTTMGIDRLTAENLGQEKVIETQLDLRNGRILGHVKKLAQASKYEVKTPQGVAGIRGTRYDISANGTVRVLEGSVVVVYVINGQPLPPVTVNAGQTVTPPAAPGQDPMVVQTPPDIQNGVMVQIDDAVRGTDVVAPPPTVIITLPSPEDAQNGDPVDTLPESEI